MRVVHVVLAALLVTLGAGHTVLTPLFHPLLTLPGAWFAGAGLALVYLGLINIAAARARPRGASLSTVVANVLGLVFAGLVVAVLPEPQAFVAMGLIVGLTLVSVAARRPGPGGGAAPA